MLKGKGMQRNKVEGIQGGKEQRKKDRRREDGRWEGGRKNVWVVKEQ